MNWFLLTANLLTVLAFIIHTFVGDREIRLIEPSAGDLLKTEKWTMARCGWHWISVDLLLASIGLTYANFGPQEAEMSLILQILGGYFLLYGLIWGVVIIISKHFPGRWLKLGQWALLLLIGGLIWIGS